MTGFSDGLHQGLHAVAYALGFLLPVLILAACIATAWVLYGWAEHRIAVRRVHCQIRRTGRRPGRT
ncbi:hypothetical protein [Blastococcus sp. CT_GayMR16]|uniref:hypothetical protein n=1 Tax=Blastococcus sp. CT_GayMR16 TaxID=2559607 RepID=UPI00107464DE|nr:hypothetical protein [Blastococcus sp. CT_GayMR16]TFV91390.1 hypothetical protein E4P38_02040 [Blastococcus sp. CT_GayMR16]